MKKIFAGVLAVGLLSSCSLGDDTPTGNNNNNNNIYNTNIVGVWKIKTEYQISGTNKVNVIKENAPDDCKKKSTYEFTNEGKYIMIDYNNVGSNCEKKDSTLPYLYEPPKMKLTINNNEAEVLDLTSNQLTILVPANTDFNGDGTPDFVKTIFYK